MNNHKNQQIISKDAKCTLYIVGITVTVVIAI